jgi:hypothetical protein
MSYKPSNVTQSVPGTADPEEGSRNADVNEPPMRIFQLPKPREVQEPVMSSSVSLHGKSKADTSDPTMSVYPLPKRQNALQNSISPAKPDESVRIFSLPMHFKRDSIDQRPTCVPELVAGSLLSPPPTEVKGKGRSETASEPIIFSLPKPRRALVPLPCDVIVNPPNNGKLP